MNLNNQHLTALRACVQSAVDDGTWPAAQFAVARDGELQAVESFGQTSDSDRFCLFSATKPVFASLVWQLIGEGLLRLDTRIADIWPRFGANGKDDITLEQVLLHTGGFPTATIDRDLITARDSRAAQMEDWKTEWEPGTRYEYHGTSAHWVLSEVVSRVTGQDHRQALRSRVLDPLGLDRLELGVAESRQNDFHRVVATGAHAVEAMQELTGAPVDADAMEANMQEAMLLANDPELVAVGVPGGNAFSSAADVAMFYQALLHDELGLWNPDVLAQATGEIRNSFPDPLRGGAGANRTIGVMVTGPDDGSVLEFPSLGLTVPMRPFGPTVSERAFGHGGFGGQTAWADPATGLSFCLLVNGMARDALADFQRHIEIESHAARCATD
ncbi:serine hydrolase domain-containing protein [Streptomyces fractus]|uniref:serine hydrolase domain-containing protein n=1 Tax=Streptomyces fractus TaxID=641806 RepID=UPI003CECF29C